MDHFDVAIIGAGPAGTACAITLARLQVRVAIVEKNLNPQAKVCGEGILPPGVARLKSLEIFANLYTKKHEILGLRYLYGDLKAETSFTAEPALGVNRQVLANALIKTLAEHKNITLISGAKYENFEPKTGLITLKGQPNISTKFLIGADGLRSRVRKSLGLDNNSHSIKRFAISAHFDIKPWTNLVEIYLSQEVEAYVTPVGSTLVNIVFLWSPTKISTPKNSLNLFSYFLDQFPALKSELAYGILSEKPRATGPFYIQPKTLFSGLNAALIGDAAGYIDPLTGEGISLGLLSGILLGDIIGPKLATGLAIKHTDLIKYQTEYKKHAKAHKIISKMGLYLTSFPRLTKLAIKIFSRWPTILDKLVQANMGNNKKLI